MKAFRAKITGKVQGVWFRKYTKETADRLNIKGFVRNEPDGSVYVEAEGNEEDLDFFAAWLHKGSPLSRVDHVEIQPMEIKNYKSFTIKR